MLTFADRNRGQGRGYWHQLGKEQADENITALQATEDAGLDYTVSTQPLSTSLPDGTPVALGDYFAVVSEHKESPEAIAVVGPQFRPIQNTHIAEMLDRSGLVGPGGTYALDVVGRTKDARKVFWSLKNRTPDIIAGDEYNNHWIITDGKDGGSALSIALTPVRVVCSNALAMAAAGASIKVGISHTSAAEEELAWWLGIAPQLQAAAEKSKRMLEVMASTPATDAMVDEVLSAAYPKFKVSGRARLAEQLPELVLSAEAGASIERAVSKNELANTRILARRQFVKDLFVSYGSDPEERNIAGTLLGVVNAVADVENHREASSAREDVAGSNFDGPRYATIAKATKKAVALIG